MIDNMGTVNNDPSKTGPKIDKTKVATVKALREGGLSIRQVAETLGMGKSTVQKYEKLSDSDITQLKDAIKKHWLVKDFTIADKAYTKLDQKLDEDKISPRDLVGLWKIARDHQRQNSVSGTAIQININSDKGNVSIESNEV